MLKKNFNETFLIMSEKDEKGLANYKGFYKLHKKKQAIVTYLFKKLNLTLAGTGAKPWQMALNALAYYYVNFHNLKLV